ncbi:hypothetical protein MYG64_36425 (plasmid) [Ensifer adhaerens]|uniref:hypothetical protein n=1 Tax=Ensifer adhaerens TaxID=106592 RepID=UPI0021019D29|nr:hypothetical protein [Ensifer adhaerens]UTV41881.1 hypothetical protein MYG64_36425 [Ensifer adhaerens]
MTVAPPVETATLPIASAQQESIPVASQNLFEHSALTANTLPHGASPADLGRTIVKNLQGFVERAGRFANGNTFLTKPGDSPNWQSFGSNGAIAQANVTRTSDSEAGRLVDALGKIFDHAIETQMVVRAPTQFTSATMTLTKGQ